MRVNPARQQAMSQPLPPKSDVRAVGSKRQKLSKYERRLAEEEEREAKWEQVRAQKRVSSGQLLLQPGSFPLFRPPLPPAKPPPSNSGGAGSKWLSEGEQLALYRPLSYPPGSLPPPSAAFLALLDAEAAQFVQSVRVADDERQRKTEVLQRVKAALQPLWPSVDVQPFGSFPLDLSLSHSDVDAVLLIDTRRDAAAELRDVQTVLTCMPHVIMPTFKLVGRARVPILRYTDNDRDVKVDLCINATDGVRAVAAMRQYMQQHAEMRPLVLCLKLLMRRAGVSEVYSGGVNSYIVQLMTVFFLQMYHRAADDTAQPQHSQQQQQQSQHERSDAEAEQDEVTANNAPSRQRQSARQSTSVEAESISGTRPVETGGSSIGGSCESGDVDADTGRVGMLLYSFLDFYGHRFDYVNYGVQLGLPASADCPGGRSCQYYSKLERGRLSADNPFLLSIEDPLDGFRDCGAASFGILRVQRCMQLAQERLALMAAEWQHTGSIAASNSNGNGSHQQNTEQQEQHRQLQAHEARKAEGSHKASEAGGREDDGGEESQQCVDSQLSRKEHKKRRKERKEERKRAKEQQKAQHAAGAATEEDERRKSEEERMRLGPILTQLTSADLYVPATLQQRGDEKRAAQSSSAANPSEQRLLRTPKLNKAEDSHPKPEADSGDSDSANGTAETPRSADDESGSKDGKEDRKRRKRSGDERLTRKQRRRLREEQAHARNLASTATLPPTDEAGSEQPISRKTKRKGKHTAASE